MCKKLFSPKKNTYFSVLIPKTNTMKKIILIVFTLGLAFSMKAQQEPQMTHFMFDKLSINPAVAGFGDGYCFTAINRKQWAGANIGEPSTLLVNLNAPKINLLKGGLGFTYIHDQLGVETNNVFRLSYSLHLSTIGRKPLPGDFGIGISASYFTKRVTGAWITPDGTPITGPGSDPSIPYSLEAEGAMSFNAGLYYKQEDLGSLENLYIGASATNLSQAELKNLQLTGRRHYYFMGGVNVPINFYDTKLRFNTLIKADGTKTQADFNVNAMVNKRFWAGVSYRHNDAIAPMAGIEFPFGLKVGYAYGVATNFVGGYFSNGNHEILLNYCFTVTIPERFTRSVHPYLL